MNPPPVEVSVILRLKDLAQRYGCDVRTIFRYHVEGVIPAGRYLPKKPWPFWYQHEILANENKAKKLGKGRLVRQMAKAAPTPPVQQFSLFP